MDSRKRWQYVFARASKIKTCGQETEDGCGCRQPSRIKKDGLATIFAEWDEDTIRIRFRSGSDVNS